jgi:hypothetical protein
MLNQEILAWSGPFVMQYFLLQETFCYRRRFVKETFCSGDVLLRRRFVRRRFVEETLCKEMFCTYVRRLRQVG